MSIIREMKELLGGGLAESSVSGEDLFLDVVAKVRGVANPEKLTRIGEYSRKIPSWFPKSGMKVKNMHVTMDFHEVTDKGAKFHMRAKTDDREFKFPVRLNHYPSDGVIYLWVGSPHAEAEGEEFKLVGSADSLAKRVIRAFPEVLKWV